SLAAALGPRISNHQHQDNHSSLPKVIAMSDSTVTLDSDLEQIFQQLDKLPLGKASQLVKAMESRWGVSAAAPAMAMAAMPAAAAAAPVEEKTTFDVILKAGGA